MEWQQSTALSDRFHLSDPSLFPSSANCKSHRANLQVIPRFNNAETPNAADLSECTTCLEAVCGQAETIDVLGM